MKLSVEFPSIAYREGPAAVARLAKAIEDIGFDQLDMFDHVLMGYPTETRAAPIYPPQMPIMEALMVLAFAAAVTEHIGLGTEVLVLPQRQPVLVAKQISMPSTCMAKATIHFRSPSPNGIGSVTHALGSNTCSEAVGAQ